MSWGEGQMVSMPVPATTRASRNARGLRLSGFAALPVRTGSAHAARRVTLDLQLPLTSTSSDFDLDFRPRSLVPWLSSEQERVQKELSDAVESGTVIRCPLPEALRRRRARRCPNGRYPLASFAAEPSANPCPCRGFLFARPVKGRRFEIEDSRNTRKGVESFGMTLAPRIPSMRDLIAIVDDSLNRGWEEFGPILPTWQETVRQRYLRWPGDWTFWVRSLNYPQLEPWYRRQWDELGRTE